MDPSTINKKIASRLPFLRLILLVPVPRRPISIRSAQKPEEASKEPPVMAQ